MVNLVHAEAEAAALRGWLGERAETGWISSVLTEPSHSARSPGTRRTPCQGSPAVLDQIELIGPEARSGADRVTG